MSDPRRPWRISIDREPRKAMRRLPGNVRQRIDQKIRDLAEDPRPAGCEPVRNAPKGTYRVWVGRYRVVYTVLDAERVIAVARVRKRDESTYRGL